VPDGRSARISRCTTAANRHQRAAGQAPGIYQCAQRDTSAADAADDADFNKPIWLTEFACGDKPSTWTSITVQNRIDYVNAAVPWLEGDSRIIRYAWLSENWPLQPYTP
jgi:hypothetical protein